MIKRYSWNPYDSEQIPYEEGEWVKYEDVENLLNAQFQKLNIEDGDKLIITSDKLSFWDGKCVENYLGLIREIFKPDVHKPMVIFTGDQRIEIVKGNNTEDNNETNL
jgi:hypothetical protein